MQHNQDVQQHQPQRYLQFHCAIWHKSIVGTYLFTTRLVKALRRLLVAARFIRTIWSSSNNCRVLISTLQGERFMSAERGLSLRLARYLMRCNLRRSVNLLTQLRPEASALRGCDHPLILRRRVVVHCSPRQRLQHLQRQDPHFHNRRLQSSNPPRGREADLQRKK